MLKMDSKRRQLLKFLAALPLTEELLEGILWVPKKMITVPKMKGLTLISARDFRIPLTLTPRGTLTAMMHPEQVEVYLSDYYEKKPLWVPNSEQFHWNKEKVDKVTEGTWMGIDRATEPEFKANFHYDWGKIEPTNPGQNTVIRGIGSPLSEERRWLRNKFLKWEDGEPNPLIGKIKKDY